MRIVLAGIVFSGAVLWAAQAREAQQRATTVDRATIVRDSPAFSSCPVNIAVKQGVGSKMMAVDRKGLPLETFAARLKLLLSDARPNGRMVEARVTVRGLNGRGQIVPAGSRQDRTGEVVRSMSVTLDADKSENASGDLLLPGFTSAKTVRVESITFENGTVWSLAIESGCSAVPDPLMRVDRSQ